MGASGKKRASRERSIPPNIPRAYPKPFILHQYHLRTFGIITPAPSDIIIQPQIMAMESAWSPMRMPSSTSRTVAIWLKRIDWAVEALGRKYGCQMSRTMKEAPLLTVELKVDMKAARRPAMTKPLIPTGRNFCRTCGITFSGSVTPVTAVRARRVIPAAIAQRTTRKKLQAAPTLAASRGFLAARNLWKSYICAGPPAFINRPFNTQTITSAPKNWKWAFSVAANFSIRQGTLSEVQSAGS